MALAKYLEDNNEMMIERLNTVNSLQNVYIEISAAIPLMCFPLEVSIDIDRKLGRKEVQKYQDKKILCKECGKAFVFSVKEQKRFAKKKYHDPKRCRDCR